MDLGTSNAIATGTGPAPATAQRPPRVSKHDRSRWRRDIRDRRLGDAAIVVLPALLAFVLCLVGITARSLGFDESATAAIVLQHGAALRAAIAHDGGNMSGYYVLMHALVSVFGRGMLALRLPSAIGIGAAVALTAMLGLRLFDRRAALAAALLSTVTVSLVFWGQSARSYALMVALSCASFLAFVALVSRKEGELSARRSWKPWVAYVLLSALAMYMSLMAALVVVAQLATIAWWWRRRRFAVLSAVATIGVLIIPLALLAAGRGSGQVAWVSRPKFVDVEQVLEALTGAGLQPSIHATATTFVLLWLTVAALGGIAAAQVVLWRRGAGWRATFGPGLLLSWLIVPVVLAGAESLVAQPLFLPRNLLFGVPAVALLLGWGLTRTGVGPRFALAGFTVLLVLRILQLAPSYGASPEGWQGATAYVVRQTHRGDCVLFYPADGRMGFQYYLPSGLQTTGVARGRVPRPVLPTAPWNQVRTYVEQYRAPTSSALGQIHSSCRRLWFISTHPGRIHGSSVARADYRRYVDLRDSLEARYTHHNVRQFGWASPVRVEMLGG